MHSKHMGFRGRLVRAAIIASAIAAVVMVVKRRRSATHAAPHARAGVPSDNTTVSRIVGDSGDAGYHDLVPRSANVLPVW